MDAMIEIIGCEGEYMLLKGVQRVDTMQSQWKGSNGVGDGASSVQFSRCHGTQNGALLQPPNLHHLISFSLIFQVSTIYRIQGPGKLFMEEGSEN